MPITRDRLRDVGRQVVDAAQAVPALAAERTAAPYAALDDGLQSRLYTELHEYPRKSLLLARLAWLTLGLLGIHRYYLGQTGRALLMTVTGGGLLVWWVVDGFVLRGMVERYNAEQSRREAADAPALGFDFIPKARPGILAARPLWAVPRSRFRSALGLVADTGLLLFVGIVLGAVSADDEFSLNGIWAVVAVALRVNFADRFVGLHAWPLGREMVRWDFRLRLFYHFNKPGNAFMLFWRPLVGLVYAPFSRKARTEALLYSEIAGIFAAAALLGLVFSGDAFRMLMNFDVGGFAELWVKSVVLGFFVVFGLVSPIGATLMKHTLQQRPAWVRWLLCGLTLAAVAFGYTS